MTSVEPVHIAHFRSILGIADAKGEIFSGLEPGGVAIVPHDNPYLTAFSPMWARRGRDGPSASAKARAPTSGAEDRVRRRCDARGGRRWSAAGSPTGSACRPPRRVELAGRARHGGGFRSRHRRGGLRLCRPAAAERTRRAPKARPSAGRVHARRRKLNANPASMRAALANPRSRRGAGGRPSDRGSRRDGRVGGGRTRRPCGGSPSRRGLGCRSRLLRRAPQRNLWDLLPEARRGAFADHASAFTRSSAMRSDPAMWSMVKGSSTRSSRNSFPL